MVQDKGGLMDTLHARALKVLGLEEKDECPKCEENISGYKGADECPYCGSSVWGVWRSDAELIGMLLLELRSLKTDNFGPLYSAVAEPPDEILEALVLAVEAEKEGK